MTRVVVLAWGNESRGDDALGPLFLAAAEELASEIAAGFTFVADFQLQPEHAADLRAHDLALFVDASRAQDAPITLREIAPRRDATFTTHGMSPEAVLAAYVAAFGSAPPTAFELAIRGERFGLGESLSPSARQALDGAMTLFARLAAEPSAGAWRTLAREAVAA